MTMQDLSLTPAEAKETMMGYASPDISEAPKYAYGTSLDLNSDTLAKLGITKLPGVGEEVAITAVGKVTRISAYEEQGGSEQCRGIQITMMEIDIPSQVPATAARKLYAATSDD